MSMSSTPGKEPDGRTDRMCERALAEGRDTVPPRSCVPTHCESHFRVLCPHFGAVVSRGRGEVAPCRDRISSAGPIDIQTHYSETLDDIIERAYLPGLPRSGTPGITTDCGLCRVPAI